MLVAYVLSPLLRGGDLGFMLAMWILMTICDIITAFCIYYIGLKMYSERTALTAAILSATALSVAYYTLTRFDAFPVCLAALALVATLYGNASRGYLWTVAGFFAKIWPLLLYPFLWLYNARNSSIISEGRKRAIPTLGSALVIFVVLFALGYNRFMEYSTLVYSQTLPYLVYSYLGLISHLPFAPVGILFQILIIAIILWALLSVYRDPGDIPTLIKAITVTVFAIAYLNQYQSPQYIVWITPFVALLVAGDLRGILAFTAVQILAYIEFPMAFWSLWVNTEYVSPWAIPFFTVFFAAWGILLWRAMRCNPIESPEVVG
jgi:hypothetical protein